MGNSHSEAKSKRERESYIATDDFVFLLWS